MSTTPEFTFLGLHPGLVEGTVEAPHPYNINRDGTVRDQEFWQGDPIQLVGFQASLDSYTVDVHLDPFIANPELARGCYAVFVRSNGTLFNLLQPIVEIDMYFDQDKAVQP